MCHDKTTGTYRSILILYVLDEAILLDFLVSVLGILLEVWYLKRTVEIVM